jgi:tetratricopeptide (TPR) repeat protein
MKARRDTKTDANVAKGDAHMENAKKAQATSMFKWKPDWETAAREYREAVKMFQSSNQDRHMAALLASIESHDKTDDWNTAAKHLETAGRLYDENLTSSPQKDGKKNATRCWLQSADFYRRNGQHDKAATLMLKAATATAETSVDEALTILHNSCEIFKAEDRIAFANEHFKKCVSLALQYDKFDFALTMMKDHNAVYLKHGKEFESDVYKNLLGIVVILFHQEKYQQAHDEFKVADNIASFNTSSEWQAGDCLFEAYKKGSAEDLDVATKMSSFQYLPNRLARLARKLKFGKDVVGKGGKLAKDRELYSDDEDDGEKKHDGPDIPDLS